MAAHQSHLLVHLESFAWQDLAHDRTDDLERYGQAVVAARNHKDEIYLHPDFWALELPWGPFSTLLSEQKAGWLFPGSKAQRLLLDFLMYSVVQVSPRPARNIGELKGDFEGQNCGLIGCAMPLPPAEEWVFDEESWQQFHQNFVWHNPQLRTSAPTYFYQHYHPALRVPPAQIRDWIGKQSNTWFDRLDTPVTDADGQFQHSGKIEMHFKDKAKSCLNIDGTWKHGGFDIPKEAKEHLEEWGFVLPPDQRT
jgi:hypothetical protein